MWMELQSSFAKRAERCRDKDAQLFVLSSWRGESNPARHFSSLPGFHKISTRDQVVSHGSDWDSDSDLEPMSSPSAKPFNKTSKSCNLLSLEKGKRKLQRLGFLRQSFDHKAAFWTIRGGSWIEDDGLFAGALATFFFHWNLQLIIRKCFDVYRMTYKTKPWRSWLCRPLEKHKGVSLWPQALHNCPNNEYHAVNLNNECPLLLTMYLNTNKARFCTRKCPAILLGLWEWQINEMKAEQQSHDKLHPLEVCLWSSSQLGHQFDGNYSEERSLNCSARRQERNVHRKHLDKTPTVTLNDSGDSNEKGRQIDGHKNGGRPKCLFNPLIGGWREVDHILIEMVN